jgi:hypothetical protein
MSRFFSIAFIALLSMSPLFAQKRAGELPPTIREGLLAEGYLPEDLADLVVQDDYRTDHNGLRHLFLRQRWQGIEVWNGDIAVHTGANGEVVKVNNGTWSRMAKRVNATTPVITAEAAMTSVLRVNGIADVPLLVGYNEVEREYVFTGTAFSGEPVKVKLFYQPVRDQLLLAWNVSHYTPDGSHWWNVRIDALTGEELDRNDWVVNCGADHAYGEEDAPMPAAPNDYRVLPWPVESPNHGVRAIRNAPWTDGGIASPYGWHDTNGAVGPEYTTTRGNNVRAVEDADANNTPGASPTSATLDFDYPLDLTGAPSTYQNAAITNLFYWNNLMHDVWYQYGFNEAAGNFQSNNYGRGGTGNDYVNADAQDGSGTDNANFGTPPDGSSPRMQMYRWTYTSPNRDSDLDNGIICHEYGHGISNRLVGGPANTNCLTNAEQMGEGWSDYFGLMMTIEAGDLGTDARGVGTYVTGQPITGGGIRPAPYCTTFGVNNYTYASTNNASLAAPHGIGFVWCTMLWEMTWELIGVYGLDTDIYNGNGGNNIAMQLVIDGLKLTPCNPGFVDARDAILAADMANNGGANQAYIWAAFARRGLGVSASQGSSNNRSDQAEAFNTPTPNDVTISAITGPADSQLFDCASSALQVNATVRNDGQNTQSGFPVRYQLDGGAVITETFSGTLASAASATYIFNTPLTINGLGNHVLSVSTALVTDGYAPNDQRTMNLSVVSAASANMPFSENVDAGNAAPPGWVLQNPDNNYTWTTTALTNGPACTSTTSWSINNYGYNSPGQQDRLISPIINLGGSAATHLLFDHAYAPYSSSYNDALRVEISSDCGGTWTQLYYAIGSGLATAPTQASNYTPTACSQWQHHNIDISAFDGQGVMLRFANINDFGNWLYMDNVAITQSGLKLAVKLMLEGPYVSATNRMRDDLRTAAVLPASEPYTALGFTQASDGGGETLIPSALTTTGDNAIVDWVLVELRDAVTPSTIVATRAALLQRDGDVVDINGVSSIALLAPAGSYYVAARHRNHLGCMVSQAAGLSTSLLTGVDFTDPLLPTYGTEARHTIGGTTVLWNGNALRDAQVKYTGSSNDRDPILIAVGSATPNNATGGYLGTDTNMDGVVKYTGSGNDRDPILIDVGSTTPNNVRGEQLP